MDIPAILGVLTGFGLVVGIPVVALLLNHQRKMAEFFHGEGRANAQLQAKVDQLEAEVRELKSLVAVNVIEMDTRRGLPPQFTPRD